MTAHTRLWLTCLRCTKRFDVPLESKKHPLLCPTCAAKFLPFDHEDPAPATEGEQP